MARLPKVARTETTRALGLTMEVGPLLPVFPSPALCRAVENIAGRLAEAAAQIAFTSWNSTSRSCCGSGQSLLRFAVVKTKSAEVAGLPAASLLLIR